MSIKGREQSGMDKQYREMGGQEEQTDPARKRGSRGRKHSRKAKRHGRKRSRG